MSARVREHWSSKIGFLFAAIGSAVGLGVLWKFPYTVGQNGGALFLLAYMFCIVIIGFPVFIAELTLGRKAERAAIATFEKLAPGKPFWKLGGILGVLSSFLIMSFYSVIAGWGMSYLLTSLCGFCQGMEASEVSALFVRLTKTGDISLFWHFLFTLLTMGIVLAGVREGIEYWSKIMTRGLLGILTVLLLYCMTLPGFGQGVAFIFTPNLGAFKFSSLLEALGLAFFTLSLGQGIMFSYGSYLKRDEDVVEMAFFVSVSVLIVAIMAALVIFPVVFSFGYEPSAGTGLVFQTLPYLFSKLPGSQVVGIVFFTLFVFCAITSAIAFIEVVATNLMEYTKLSRKASVLWVSLFTFIVGIPSALAPINGLFYDWTAIYGRNFLETMDHLVSVWLIPVGGLLTTLFVGWVWDKREARAEFKNVWFFEVWHFSMRFVIPLLMILIILQKSGLVNFDTLF